jgi:DNA-binding transcriptional LysR family regulator
MNLRQLSYILTIAQEQSFSKAAKKLYISQPSLSQYVHKIETELGVKLFKRTMPLKLTYAGEQYVHTAALIFAQQERLEQILFDVREEKTGHITIGAGALNSAFILPHAITAFRQLYPGVGIAIREKIEPELFGEVKKGEYDLAITTLPVENEFASRRIREDGFLLAVPKTFVANVAGEPGGDYAYTTLAEYRRCTFIVLQPHLILHQVLDRLCRNEGFLPESKLECGSVTTAICLVQAGAGISLVPASAIHYISDWQDVRFFQIRNCNERRSISVFYNADKYLTKPESALIDILVGIEPGSL